MTKNELTNLYFEWMYQIVCDNRNLKKLSYRKLMYRLFDTEFKYTIVLDGNRAEEGISLRYRFGTENNFDLPLIASYLDNRPCSVLEMMIALALYCEEHIMDDPDAGNRTGQWFWNMVVNLGLGSMTDNRFDKQYVDDILNRFMMREYEQDGKGGLFTIEDCKYDLRSVEIWYQMAWYLSKYYIDI